MEQKVHENSKGLNGNFKNETIATESYKNILKSFCKIDCPAR